jgi:hypothetical protein
MTDSAEGVTPPTRDGWRALADDLLDAMTEHGGGDEPPSLGVWPEQWEAFSDRYNALLAAEEHLPTFHVRPVHLRQSVQVEADAATVDIADSLGADVTITEDRDVIEWRWVAIAANGRKLYGSTETYRHRSHAVDQAHEVADPMGAPVVIDAPTLRPASPLENQ